MNSLFITSKRDEALESIVSGITQGAKNCATVLKKINVVCQNPNQNPDVSVLINEWCTHLFTNQFHDFIDEWVSPRTISEEKINRIENSFFNYFATLTPLYYENKTIISPDIFTPKKYKWTNEDFNALKIALFTDWFREDFESSRKNNFKNHVQLEARIEKIVKEISLTIKTKKSMWNKDKKLTEILFPNSLIVLINEIKPDYPHPYQNDLFLNYTYSFIKNLPTVFQNFNDTFYERGTYLHEYFQWTVKK